MLLERDVGIRVRANPESEHGRPDVVVRLDHPGHGRKVPKIRIVRQLQIELAQLESAQARNVPEGSAQVAAIFVAAIRGKRDPAFGGGEENG